MIKLLFCCLFVLSFEISAQSFLNLDFEYGVWKEQPRKWSVEGEGDYYFASLDSSTSQSGNKSLKLTLKNAQAYIFLSLPGNSITGKKVTFSGYLKLQGATDSLKLMMAFKDPNGRPIASPVNTQAQNQWMAVTHENLFAEYRSDRLLIALIAVGSGEFWFDNAAIDIDGTEIGKGKPDFRAPTPREIEILNKKVAPLTSTESLADIRDLDAIGKMIGKSRVVALGENSHGSASVYRMKLRMVKYLVEKKGFTIFALETPVAEADKINDYVVRGVGSREDILKNLVYKSWQTPEMLAIIEWLRSYNKKANPKISFRGFDIQNGLSAFQEAEIFIKNHLKQLVPDLLQLRLDHDHAMLTNQHWDSVHAKAKRLHNRFMTQTEFPSVKSEELSRFKLYMNVFVQSLSARYQSKETKSRDEYMAENIEWLVKNSPFKSKFIISADNSHVSRESGKMGNRLKQYFGNDYFVFGFTFSKGTYFAYGQENSYEVHPAHIGTFEYLFSTCKYSNFIIDLRSLNDLPLLGEKMGFRSIGSRPQETSQFSEKILGDLFDAVIFIDRSQHTIPY